MKIYLEKGRDKYFRLSINGKEHSAQFKSPADAAEWLGCMQAHGLYLDWEIHMNTDEGEKTIQPTYEFEVEMPSIALA